MPIAGRVPRLNGEAIFKLWAELGTLRKVRKYLVDRDVLNPITENPYSQMTIWVSAHRWVLENPDLAREYYKDYGSAFEDKAWDKHLIQRALTIYSKPRFMAWCRKQGFDEKYGSDQLAIIYDKKGKFRKYEKKGR